MSGELVGSIIGISPLVIILVMLIFVVRRSRKNMSEMIRINEELIVLNREMVARLKNIEDILRSR